MKPRALALASALGIGLSLRVVEGRGAERDTAAAERLFQEGRALVAEGKTADGCAKLAESQRLDPADGTSINLGQCWEKLGRTASAWGAYREAAALAEARGERARGEFARARARDLEPNLARLEIRVPPSGRPSGLVIERNGVVLGEAAWGDPLPTDPGESLLEARAPGHRRYMVRVTLTPGTTTAIDIPPLERERAETSPVPPPSRTSPLRILGISAGVAGGAAVATGLVLGAIAKTRNDAARADECIVPVGCTERGAAMIDEARTFAGASTALVIAGGAVAVAGLILVLVSGAPAQRSTTSRLALSWP